MNRDTEAKQRLTRRRLRKGVYVLPSFITCINIYMGFYAVVESVKGYKYIALNDPETATRHFDIAALCIGWSVLCDFLDGRIARLMKATSDFGVQLDSLADVLSFGIAPAVLLYTWGFSGIPAFQKLAWGAAFIHLICCALRLARFNVQASKPLPVETNAKTAKRFFVGLPTPAAAGLLAAIVHFTPLPVVYQETYYRMFGQEFVITPVEWAIGLFALAVTLALLMVSTLRFNSFKDLGPYAQRPQVVLLSLGLLIFFVYNYSEWTLLILAILYAGQGPAGKLAGLFRRKATPTTTPASAETVQ
ncbi:MAG: phosphatidylcholine/phosphatidylserine synthase [Chloracidobacterium sp.]|uniref:Phosphatidylcholine/phosphatidylserine synthase n=1 Tax=Chloracidobacterium validum TaxID=2821543 RepID=A0ABX8BAB8_9BACT|nr:phosphatidylcholine/phosphatidylserine synthase [Chloracidobacterium validum]QUW03362.1 phosphatidylcholine/phosphatidylserine synthase [Chloracidobacterium validum]